MECKYSTAREIKEMTDAYAKDQDEIKLDEIYRKISSRVILGKYSLIIYEQLSKANKDFLKNSGFKIYDGPIYCCCDNKDVRSDVFTTISWEEI